MNVKYIYQENGGFPIVIKLQNDERKMVHLQNISKLDGFTLVNEPAYKKATLTDNTIIEVDSPLPVSPLIVNYNRKQM